MGKMLLGLAAAAMATLAAPAVAGHEQGAKGAGPVASFNGSGNGHGHHGGNTGFGNGGVWISAGEWARYNNEAFKSDSYNDWWHDRPDRAYPAWVRNNRQCRLYWSGGGWRC
jgi:hypothetical protein